MPMEMEIYFYRVKKLCSSKVEIFLHTVRVIFCFKHLEYSLLMLISFLKISGGYAPLRPLAHYVSVCSLPNIIQTLTPPF